MSVTTSSPVAAVAAGERVTPASILMYLAAFLVTASGLLGVGLILNDETGFIRLTLLLAGAGHVVSYLIRRQNVQAHTIEMPAAIICVFLALAALMGDRGLPFLAPAGIEDDRAKGLAVLLTWIIVFRSFTLVTDGALLFCCVPTIAVVGLAGTMTSEPALVQYFSVFIGAAAFMLVHENFLRTRNGNNRRAPTYDRALFAGQIQLALACAVGSLLLAHLFAVPLQAVGSAFALNPNLGSQQGRTQGSRVFNRPTFSELPTVQVGTGPVTLSDQVVMRVRSELGSYWRGSSFNIYTGRGWMNGLSAPESVMPVDERSVSQDPFGDASGTSPYATYLLEPSEVSPSRGAGPRLKQRVQLVGNSVFNALYYAPEARIVRAANVRLQVDAAGSLQVQPPAFNTTYEVESDVPDFSPERLRSAPTSYPELIQRNYLSGLDTMDSLALERVRAAALEVTQNQPTVYDKALALQNWISSSCKYNLQARAIPPGHDVVEYFLFTGKEGYCDSFATALAVACRSIGIPARVASGFLPGTYDPETREYVIKERDKHQWTEVYFPGAGWAPFDATSDAEDISERQDDAAKGRNPLLALLFGRGILPPMALLVFLLMIAYVLKVEVWDRLRVRPVMEALSGLPETNIAVVEAYLEVIGLLGRRGHPRLPSFTPDEYLRRTRAALQQWPAASEPLQRLTALAIRARYGPDAATDEDVRLAREAAAQLRNALKVIPRRELILAAETA